MPSFIVGALRVILGLDTAAFEKGAKEATSHLALLGKSLKSFGASFLGALTVGSVVAAFKSIINHADQMGKVAERIGIPVEELSRLAHVAKLADLSFEELTGGVNKLARSMVQVAQGSTGPASQAFKALQINVKNADGSMKSASQVLLEVSNRFSRMEDGVVKASLSTDLFGRNLGSKMIPLLNQGSEAINEMMMEADQLGIVISAETARNADVFNDNLDRLGQALRGVLIQLIGNEGLGAALAAASEWLVQLANDTDFAEKAADGLGKFLIEMIAIVLRLNAAWKEFLGWIAAAGQSFEMIKNNQINFLDPFRKHIAETNKSVEELNAQIANLRAGGLGGLGGTAGTQTVNRSSKGTFNPVIQNTKEIEESARKAAKAMEELKNEGQKVWEDTRTPLENFQLEMRRLNDLFEAGVIDAETYGRAVRKLQDEFSGMSDIVKDVADTIEGSMTSAFDSILEGTFNLRDALNDLLKDIAKLFAHQAIKSLLGTSDGSAGILGSLFAGGRASGGSVAAGRSYVVGERGPELFTPGRSGMISPAGSFGGGIKIIDQRTTSAAPIQARQGADGSMEFIIRDTIRKVLPSELNRTMPGQFGARPRLTQRGS